MAATKPGQLVFVDGSFQELAQEMADYINIGDDVRALLEKNQKDEVLKKIILGAPALNAIPEKEFTAAYNLLIYLVLQSPNSKQFLPRVCENLMKPITSSPNNGPGLALNALTTIYNLLEPDNETRFHVFMAILRFVKQHSMFENLKPSLEHIDRLLGQWDVDEEDQRKLYETVADVALEAGEEKSAYEFVLRALRTFDEDEVKSEEAQRLSIRAVKSALLSPSHFDFADLLALPTVQSLSDSHPAYFELLEVFAEKDLEDYMDFQEEHDGFIEKEELDGEKLHRKMRLLTFASLAASTPNREIPYAQITKALQVPSEEVELWTIDVIRAGLVQGKLSQKQQVFLVHMTTYRVFSEKQWRELSDRIDAYKSTLRSVLEVVRREQANQEAARKREADEIERKLANVGMGGVDRQGGRGNRPTQRKERTDDDD